MLMFVAEMRNGRFADGRSNVCGRKGAN
jgi:hypothetical protein